MSSTTARIARIATHAGVAVVAQLVLATATASAGPTTGAPCTVPAAPTRPARHTPEPVHPIHPHLDIPVRAGDLCAVDGATATAQPGTRPVVCGHHRGLNHLTWG